MARPSLGPRLVEKLEGPEDAKRRLRVILEVIAKEKRVEEACAELGIERARFYQLQDDALVGAIEGLTPRSPGRPSSPAPSADALKIRELEATVDALSVETQALRIREELARVLPDVARRAEVRREKKRRVRKPW